MGKVPDMLWLDFKSDDEDIVSRTFSRLIESLQQAGINVSYADSAEAELRNKNFDSIEVVNF